MEDEKIIDLYWERNQRAVGVTEEKYGAYCRKIAWNILYNQEDCEECVNDTWLRAWNAMPDERPCMLSAFLGAITRNLSLDRYRKLHAGKRGNGEMAYVYDELSDCIAGEGPEEQADANALTETLNAFLKQTEKENRMIFIRRYWYMESVGAIAKKYGISESKVKSSLFRTRNKLRAYLHKEGYQV